MNIAEFFVKLGVKGEDSAGKALSNVKNNMMDLSAKGLAVKGAIIGAVYGLQNLMSDATKAGVGLDKFSRSTDLSTSRLQEWQNAGRMASVGADSISSSIENVQNSMAKMKMGLGAPEGLGMLGALTDFDETKIDDTFYMMKKIQEMSQQLDAPTAKRFAQSFGISDEVFGAMRAGAFTDKNMKSQEIYSQRQIKNLHGMSVAWDNMYHRMEMTTGKFFADSGPKLVNPIVDASKNLNELVGTFVGFENSLGIVDKLGLSLKAVADSIKMINESMKSFVDSDSFKVIKIASEGIGNLFDWTKYYLTESDDAKSRNKMFSGIGSGLNNFGNWLEFAKDDTSEKIMDSFIEKSYRDRLAKSSQVNNDTKNIVNNNNININGAQDPKAVAKEINSIVNKAYKERTGGLGE